MTATEALPLAITVFCALAAWAGLRSFGGKKYRQYAVPVAGAILLVGTDYAYDLPWWSYVAAFFLTPLFYHKSLKNKLAKTAREIQELKDEKEGVRLLYADDVPGDHAGLWRVAPLEGSGSPQGLPLVKLELQGNVEDEYQVILTAPVRPFKNVSLVLHHKEADTLASRMTKAAAIELMGAPSWFIARADPFDFGLVLLDRGTIGLVSEIIDLRTDEREVFVQLDGVATRVISSRTFDKAELETLLKVFLTWHARACAQLANYRVVEEGR